VSELEQETKNNQSHVKIKKKYNAVLLVQALQRVSKLLAQFPNRLPSLALKGLKGLRQVEYSPIPHKASDLIEQNEELRKLLKVKDSMIWFLLREREQLFQEMSIRLKRSQDQHQHHHHHHLDNLISSASGGGGGEGSENLGDISLISVTSSVDEVGSGPSSPVPSLPAKTLTQNAQNVQNNNTVSPIPLIINSSSSSSTSTAAVVEANNKVKVSGVPSGQETVETKVTKVTEVVGVQSSQSKNENSTDSEKKTDSAKITPVDQSDLSSSGIGDKKIKAETGKDQVEPTKSEQTKKSEQPTKPTQNVTEKQSDSKSTTVVTSDSKSLESSGQKGEERHENLSEKSSGAEAAAGGVHVRGASDRSESAELKELKETASTEIKEWMTLSDSLATTLDKYRMVCKYCHVRLLPTTVNTKCPGPVQENIVTISKKVDTTEESQEQAEDVCNNGAASPKPRDDDSTKIIAKSDQGSGQPAPPAHDGRHFFE